MTNRLFSQTIAASGLQVYRTITTWVIMLHLWEFVYFPLENFCLFWRYFLYLLLKGQRIMDL